jgi:hypothetical protein
VNGSDGESAGSIKVADIRQWASMYFEDMSIDAPFGYDLYIAQTAESEGTKVSTLEIDVSISALAFSNCQSIEKIILRNGCQAVNLEAFSFCRNLSSVYISDSIIYFGVDVFLKSEGLTEITVKDVAKFIQSGRTNDLELLEIGSLPFYELYQADTPDSEKSLVTKVILPTLYTCSLVRCTSITEIV